MNAVIMAGGYGNRLKPLTDTVPKPMLNIAGRPMIDYCVAGLSHYGIKDVVFSLGYLPEKIIEWAIGYKDIKTHFFVEDFPLGTLGGVKAAADKLTDVFVVVSGDGLNDIDLNAMLSRHLATKAEVTMAVKELDDPSLYGVAALGQDGLIKGFIEKPHDIKSPAYINCGAYVVDKKVLSYVKGENCDFARDLFPLLVERGTLGYYRHAGYWRDIGDFESYYKANFDMLDFSFFPRIKNVFDNDFKSSLIGDGEKGGYSDSLGASGASLVADTARVEGRLLESIVGRGSIVEANSFLNRCIVIDGATASGRHKGCIFSASGVRIDILDERVKERIKAGETGIRPLF